MPNAADLLMQDHRTIRRLLAQLDSIHAKNPIDAIVITGDMTDAGRSAEWSEFFDALMAYPPLVETTGRPVAQAEHTLYVGADGVEVLTR